LLRSLNVRTSAGTERGAGPDPEHSAVPRVTSSVTVAAGELADEV
jgi:hypothetical protein